MATDQILQLLIAERERLNRAIEALQGPARRRGRPPAGISIAAPAAAPARRKRTAAQNKAQSERMKAYWAKRRREQARKS